MKKITHAIFPVAGLGTRFLPATKSSPKEMLPIVDKPLIQYAVEEAVSAGITDLIFITGRTKNAISDHFDMSYELEKELARQEKYDLLNKIQHIIPSYVTCIYIRQSQALGLGHALLLAKTIVKDNPFAVLLADDLMDGAPSVMKQMVDIFQKNTYSFSLVSVQNVPRNQINQYGIAETEFSNQTDSEQTNKDRIAKISNIIEKPLLSETSSNLAVVGRYILTPAIFKHLESISAGKNGEFQLTDAIKRLLQEETVLAYRYEGERYDCGTKLGYLEATVKFGLKHAECGDKFRILLKKMIGS